MLRLSLLKALKERILLEQKEREAKIAEQRELLASKMREAQEKLRESKINAEEDEKERSSTTAKKVLGSVLVLKQLTSP